jgi:hypothetical protein
MSESSKRMISITLGKSYRFQLNWLESLLCFSMTPISWLERRIKQLLAMTWVNSVDSIPSERSKYKKFGII